MTKFCHEGSKFDPFFVRRKLMHLLKYSIAHMIFRIGGAPANVNALQVAPYCMY